MNVEIRHLTADDVEVFRALRLEALAESPEGFGRTLEEERELALGAFRELLSKSAVFCAFDSGRAVGMVGFYGGTNRKERHRTTLWGMYVRPSLRDRGVGRQLVDRGLEYLRLSTSVEQVVLSVVTTNAAAIRLYESLGFETYGTEPRALKSESGYRDERLMLLRLR